MYKLHINPSTFKLAFDPVTKKLQGHETAGANCKYCEAGKTPLKIDVTLSGLTDCIGVCHPRAWDWQTYLGGAAAVINGNTYRLTQQFTEGAYTCTGYEYNCIWGGEFPGNYGTIRLYGNHDCTGNYTEYNMDTLRIIVGKTATDKLFVHAHIAVKEGPYYRPFAMVFLFDAPGPPILAMCSGNTAVITGCANATVNNMITCNLSGEICASYNGTAIIEEV